MKKQEIIGSPFKNIPIVKVIYNDIVNNHKYKLIFVGPQSDEIKNILKEYLKNNGKLNKSDDELLKKNINYYDRKFNINFEDTNTTNIFVYYYIENNLNVRYFQNILHYIIKNDNLIPKKNYNVFKPDNQLIFKYSIRVSYDKIVSVLNFIFKKESDLENKEFVDKILKIFSFSEKELYEKLEIIQKNNTFLKKDIFRYTDLLSSDIFHKLILFLPQILTFKYFIGEDHQFYYHNNVYNVIKNKNKIDTKNVQIYDDSEYLYDLIYDENRVYNNEFHLVIKDDVNNILTSEMVDFYFPIHQKINIDIKNFYNIYSTYCKNISKNNLDNKNKNNKNYFNISKNNNKNLIIELYSDNLHISPKIDLEAIYNNFPTNYYLPVIKYYLNNEPVDFKINKMFLRNHDYLEITNLLTTKKILKTDISQNYNYLQIKWRIKKNFILTINLYQSGYMLVFFEDDKYTDIHKNIIPYSRLINTTIRKLKQILTLKMIPMPNIETLFYETSNKIYFNKLITANIQSEIKININIDEYIENYNKKLGSKKKENNISIIISLIKSIIKKNFHQFIVNESSFNSIKLLYKEVNNFYDVNNVKQFIYKYIQKNKLNNKTKELLIGYINKYFYLDKTFIEKIIDNIKEYEPISQFNYLSGVEITLKMINDTTIQFNYDNISSFETLKKINFYFENIIKQIQEKNDDIKSKTKIKNSEDNDKKKSESKDVNSILDNTLDLQDVIDDDLNLDLDLGDDFALDIEDDDILLENDIFDENIESDFDKNLNDLHNLIDMEMTNEDDSSSDSQFKKVEIKKFDVNKKLKFKEYMKKMRKHFDQDLYEIRGENGKIIYSYGIADCDNKQMRQPYIVTKQELDSYDPEALTGYIKYRNNYYICPRIWDVKENAPISVRKFIENGLKSPYNNGLPVPPSRRDQVVLGDDYTVIIRKGTNDTYWEDQEDENYKKWPELLKGTEKDAFPGFAKPTKHPKNICVPCCFKRPAKDYDPNKKEIQQFFKSFGYEKCNIDTATNSKKDESESNSLIRDDFEVDYDSMYFGCINVSDLYILSEINNLQKCKLGLLPENIDSLLNNHQSLFLSKTGNVLLNKCNVLLVRGINNNKNIQKYNILESWSVLIKQPLNNLINNIVKNLTPELFIELNNGELVDIFSSSNIIPYSLQDLNKFKNFCSSYPRLLSLFDLDYQIIDKIEYGDLFNNLEIQGKKGKELIRKGNEEDMEKENKKGKEMENENEKKRNLNNQEFSKLVLVYKVYKSFYNYISYILDKYEYKNYLYFLDLLSRPLKWLNRKGTNILIIENNTNNIICNPYNKINTKKIAILLMFNKYKFLPIVNCQNINKSYIIKGIFNIDNINLSEENIIYHKEKNKIKSNLLDQTSDRSKILYQLINIHHNKCKNNIKKTSEFLKSLDDIIYISEKIIQSNTQLEYISISYSNTNKEVKSLLLPIIPVSHSTVSSLLNISILNKSHIGDLEYYLQMNNMINDPNLVLQDLLSINNLKTKKNDDEDLIIRKLITLLKNNNYGIKKLFFNISLKKIIGIKFNNNLIVPCIPIELSKINKNKYNFDKYEIENVIFDFNYQLNEEFKKITHNNVFMNDLKYNNFKFQFSRIINLKNNKNKYNELKKIIYKDQNQDGNNNKESRITKISNIISSIMKIYSIDNSNYKINKSKKKELSLKKYKFKKVYKTKKKDCLNDDLLIYEDNKDDKGCKINLSENMIDYFCYLLSHDLITNKNEFESIINGSFIPIFNENRNIFINDNEINISPKELAKIIENNIYSRYKKFIDLSVEKSNKYVDILNKNDVNNNIDVLKSILEKSIKDLTKLDEKSVISNLKNSNKNSSTKGKSSSDSFSHEDNIFTTVFDKNGIYNKKMNYNMCKFPFYHKGKLISKCVKSTDNSGLVCPTEVNNKYKPIKWGYCPSDHLKDNEPILTYGDEFNKKYKAGECKFPFLYKNSDNNIEIRYKCVEEENNNNKIYWCPISNTTGFYKAATDSKFIKKNINPIQDFIIKGKINSKYYTYKNIGYCKKPKGVKVSKKIIKEHNKVNEDIEELIKMEDYKPGKCLLGLKKNGYSKRELYNFGTKVLGIDSNLLTKDDIIIKKEELCDIINKEYRKQYYKSKIKSEKDKAFIYEKDPNKCNETNTKGGYYKNDLIEIAVNAFDLDNNKASEMSKEQLCKYIIPKVKKLRKKYSLEMYDDLSTTKSNSNTINSKFNSKFKKSFIEDKIHIEPDYMYPGKINKCKDVPGRGGKTIKELKKIAKDHFKINVSGMSKIEICDRIEKLMKLYKPMYLEDNNISELNKDKIDNILNNNAFNIKNNDNKTIDINYQKYDKTFTTDDSDDSDSDDDTIFDIDY